MGLDFNLVLDEAGVALVAPRFELDEQIGAADTHVLDFMHFFRASSLLGPPHDRESIKE